MLYSYNVYKEMVLEVLQRELGVNRVKGISVRKDNGVKREGIHLMLHGNKPAPIVYLDSSKGIYSDLDVAMFVEETLKTYESAEKCTGKGIEMLSDWNFVKDHVKIRLLNGDKNLEQLKGFLPYMEVLDLVAVFDISTEKLFPEYRDGRIRITNVMLDIWNLDVISLYEVAIQNMERDGYEFDDIRRYIGGLLGVENTEYDKSAPSMYILRTYDDALGAGAMLSKKIMKEVCSNLECNEVYILPSSVHEVIIIAAEDMEVPALKAMIREVNESVVEEGEYLSDNVYVYSANQNELKLADIERSVMVA